MYFRLVRSPEHFQTAAKHGRRNTLERRASMQRTVRIATFGIALAILFLLGTVPSAQAQDHSCSNATLDGSFGFSGTGTVFNPSASLFAQVGRQTFDGNGNTDATATTSINGASFPVTIKGTYYRKCGLYRLPHAPGFPRRSYSARRFCDRQRRGGVSSHRHRSRKRCHRCRQEAVPQTKLRMAVQHESKIPNLSFFDLNHSFGRAWVQCRPE